MLYTKSSIRSKVDRSKTAHSLAGTVKPNQTLDVQRRINMIINPGSEVLSDANKFVSRMPATHDSLLALSSLMSSHLISSHCVQTVRSLAPLCSYVALIIIARCTAQHFSRTLFQCMKMWLQQMAICDGLYSIHHTMQHQNHVTSLV